MDADTPRDLIACFSELTDPRMERTRLHRLDDIIGIAILAVICGADGWAQIEEFGHDQFDWLKTIFHLPNGIPSHDTFGRVFAMLDPNAFERCLLTWIEGLIDLTGVEAIHIDGKTLRRSFDHASSKAAIHMISAWASKAELSLGQLTTHAKSNEITAIPKLLDLLTLHGAVVTIDAMGCQTKIAEKIIERGGEYLLAVKDNQHALYEDIKRLFHEAIPANFEGMGYDFHETVDKGHGRIETRRVWVTRDVDWLIQRHPWAGLRGVVCVERVREVIDPKGGKSKISTERAYYITSVDHREKDRHAEFFVHATRSHWGIENKLHWSLDVAFKEDDCRVRQGHAAENFSRLRRLALTLLKNEKSVKRGVATKRLKAGWSHAYLLKVLGTPI